MTGMDIAEARRSRLLEFLSRYKRDADAAEHLGIQPGDLSQLKMGRRPGCKTGRNIGERRARKMEESAGLPKGWFDGIDTEAVILDERELKLINRFRAVTTEAQDKVLGWLAIEKSITFTGDSERRESLERAISNAIHDDESQYDAKK